MVCSMGKITFKFFNKDLKQGRPGSKPNLSELQSFPEKELCVVHLLHLYLKKSKANLGDISKLFITSKNIQTSIQGYDSPLGKSLLQQTDGNMTEFAAGSTRAAAGNKASQAGVPLEDILKSGGWSRQIKRISREVAPQNGSSSSYREYWSRLRWSSRLM